MSLLPVQHFIKRPNSTTWIPLASYPWLHVGRPAGLGIPRMTSEDELVPERGAQQHGSSIVLLKLPQTRRWELPLKIAKCDAAELEEIFETILISIFNPVLCAGGLFVVPKPFTYRRVSATGQEHRIDFFLEAGLEGIPDETADRKYYELNLQMSSPDVLLYKDRVVLDDLGPFLLQYVDPFGNRTWKATNNIQYDGSWTSCPYIAIQTLSGELTSITFRHVETDTYTWIRHANWLSGQGWKETTDLTAVYVYLDVCARTLTTSEMTNTALSGTGAGSLIVPCGLIPSGVQVGSHIQIFHSNFPAGTEWQTYTVTGTKTTAPYHIEIAPPGLAGTLIATENMICEPADLTSQIGPDSNWDLMNFATGTYELWVQIADYGAPWPVPQFEELSYEPKYIGILT